ncbi:MAG: type II secretion system major pseudopilin GspG [Candidatus Mucispirillum faecigallinarum]|nr:type II secretion system major pseudopilin GspG [Candidatus Mucispirillum faecigallinarum]
MKSILLSILILILLSGCINNTPKCSDDNVEKLVIELSRGQLIGIRSDLSKIVEGMTLFIDKKTLPIILKQELQAEGYSDNEINIFLNLLKYDVNTLQTTNITLDEIFSTNIDKSIKKCSCKAIANFNELGIGMGLIYEAQHTDDGKQINVTLNEIDNLRAIPIQKTAQKKYSKKELKEKTKKAQNDINALESAIMMYKLDNGNYPTTSQGLQALVKKPELYPIPNNWSPGGYLSTTTVPKDPWGNDYVYKSPAENVEADYEIYSLGADGQEGGDEYNADIHTKFLDNNETDAW